MLTITSKTLVLNANASFTFTLTATPNYFLPFLFPRIISS